MAAIFTALVIFGIASILGLTLLFLIFRNKRVPARLLLLDGLLEGVGILLLLYYTFTRTPGPIESLIVFIIATVVGGLFGYKILNGKLAPKMLAVGHEVMLLTGVLFLLSFILGWMNP